MAALHLVLLHHVLAALLLVGPAAGVGTITTIVPMPGKKDANATECQSWWSPSLVETRTNTTLLAALCKTPTRNLNYNFLVRSHDAGRTWGTPTLLAQFGEMVYSRTTGTLTMILGPGHFSTGGKAKAGPTPKAGPTLQSPTDGAPVMPQPAWASELTQITPTQQSNCESASVQSTDDGVTWSAPKLLNVVNGSLGPHYGGGGLNHGIELQNGPHAGRLALARRFDCAAVGGDHNKPMYMRSFVLYSDDQGSSWSAGELLPEGWTEDQVAEMRNGSLLMTSRLEEQLPSLPYGNLSMNRAFARSDDGGRTWAETWYLEDRQPGIQAFIAECAHALVSDPTASSSSGESTMYWGHPGGAPGGQNRNNYTLETSMDDGATWRFSAHIQPKGAGYSDAHLLHDGRLAIAYQRTFDPPVHSIEGGGYDIAVALVDL